MPIVPAHNPLTTPDFKRGTRTPRPLPPPGNAYDGRLSEDLSAHFPASPQVTSIVLGGSTATNDVTTLLIVPTAGPNGSAWSQELGEIEIDFETGETETLDAVGAGLEANASAAQSVSSLSDLSNYKRVGDLVTIAYVAASDTLTITARNSSIRFTASLSSTGSVTSTQTTAGGDDDTLRVGIVGVSDGIDSRHGRKIKAPVAASAASAILGVVMDGPGCKPQEPGYTEREYARGKDVLYRSFGSAVAYAEKAVAADAQVYVRKTAGAGEVAGAVTDTATTDTVEILTLTPSAANSTQYRMQLRVRNFFTDAVVAEGIVELAASDSDATAAEVVTGLKASLNDQTQFDDYVTDTGTDTLVLTQAAGYYLEVIVNDPGEIAVAETQAAASDHMLWEGVKFLETTTAAGSAPIYIPRAAA